MTLYKAGIERALAHGMIAWCLEPTVRITIKLSIIQRPFLLAISGAYRTTSTAALQVILGISPLHLQLQREAHGTALYRLRRPLSTNVIDIDPSEIAEKTTGCSAHPSEHPSPTQIYLDLYRLLETEKGMGAAFCVMTKIKTSHRWSTRLSLRNTVFQAEFLALLKALEHVVNSTIDYSYRQPSQHPISRKSKESRYNCRKIFMLLHSHPHIRVSWIKARAGYIGNEEADRLVNAAAETENFPGTPFELPKSFLKTFMRQKMMATRQMAWDDGYTGRLISSISIQLSTSFPKLSCNQSAGHATKFCVSQDMDLSHRFSKDSTLTEPHSALVGNRHTNPLCHGFPPHSLLPYGTTQPTTSASLDPQRSQQFNIKKEDP
ncbi:hypothetical protein AVEN_196300-1 [Araneus ventricosus]|uniref:RNase H type-1 domain-containing protein n=1 Tax=Araneus ventricosus TaxID=182803 RepID=A0A4Y2LMS9_ARAVE|nr:hypothetical protein AVEN_196300-1 [Araneus ventricosus]